MGTFSNEQISKLAGGLHELYLREGSHAIQSIADKVRNNLPWDDEASMSSVGAQLVFGIALRSITTNAADAGEELTPDTVRGWNQDTRNYGVTGFGFSEIDAALQSPDGGQFVRTSLEEILGSRSASSESEFKSALWEKGLTVALHRLQRIEQTWGDENFKLTDPHNTVWSLALGEVAIRYLNLSWLHAEDDILRGTCELAARQYATQGWNKIQGVQCESVDFSRVRDNYLRVLTPEEQLDFVDSVIQGLREKESTFEAGTVPSVSDFHLMGLDAHSVVEVLAAHLEKIDAANWTVKNNQELDIALEYLDKGKTWCHRANNQHGVRFITEHEELLRGLKERQSA